MTESTSAAPVLGLRHRLVGVLVFLIALVLYLKTLAPTVSFWDCGEFIACSYILGVPHPPGAPLYILLGRLFTLLPLGEIAWRVNLMSALSSALGIWCVYLSGVALARRALGGAALRPFGDGRDISCQGGAALGALALAVSYTYWFNATEAEVYGYSILFTTLSMWLIFYWEGTQHGTGNDRWLFLIAYLFGLGGGIHMLCLLTIPSLLILAFYADEKLRRLIGLLLGLGVWSGLALLALGPGAGSNGAMGAGLAGVLYYLYGRDRRSFGLLVGVLFLFVLGYSTYEALYIRSGLNPAIDENDPETFAAFIKFLNREQYGTDSQLLGMLGGRAPRDYQFWDLQMKYFFQQFPFPFLELPASFRRATEAVQEVVWISVVPYGLGLVGLVWHARRDRKRFWAVLALFVVMGFGLSLYLNMPDPQPRERHYVFGGMFCAFALWMGLAWTGLVELFRRHIAARGIVLAGVASCGLLLPLGIGARLYHEQDRTGDYIAYDYAYNILQSCDENSILFTNGDNDTFPLWFLQEVEEVRRDVRVVNLSLLNTGWYIKQLRDREPKIDIRYTDNFIDSVLTDTQDINIAKRYWPETKSITAAGLEWEVPPPQGYNILRVQDIMVIKIIDWNQWKKPVHIAITVPTTNYVGLTTFMQMTGMTYRLTREREVLPDAEKLKHNLFEVFQFRGVTDPAVYKDSQTIRLLTNYRAGLLELASLYRRESRGEDLLQLLNWGEEHLYFSWDSYYLAAGYLRETGYLSQGAEFMEKAGLALSQTGTSGESDIYRNLMAIADDLVDRYKEPDRAEELYRRAIRLQPELFGAHYGLAACLQLTDRAREALQIVDDYAARHGENEQLRTARKILQRALGEEEPP